ncbi:hypothetical protein Tco_0355885, partial [Tanacetum coccineum]
TGATPVSDASSWFDSSSSLRCCENSSLAGQDIVGECLFVPSHFASPLVTDIAQKDKNKAKQTKPGTRMERVQEIEAEGEFISNPIPLNL